MLNALGYIGFKVIFHHLHHCWHYHHYHHHCHHCHHCHHHHHGNFGGDCYKWRLKRILVDPGEKPWRRSPVQIPRGVLQRVNICSNPSNICSNPSKICSNPSNICSNPSFKCSNASTSFTESESEQDFLFRHLEADRRLKSLEETKREKRFGWFCTNTSRNFLRNMTTNQPQPVHKWKCIFDKLQNCYFRTNHVK